ncbi:copper amine oxidase domain protein [Paenibacillus curdlanolyticus YK9]|uniref:Copper amine oxidase domain protein n=1 Tax=Paenibacillus curdlanolyticus YK9 TaxID=717606 RepID=E0IEV9_9BACL|nr:DUF4163 domain-containing protein [Paenibacillus curdlanolyticus]EFM09197.1 copper amine oxidase domain protein [Paenibacillus curdlanolyticus YK9]
MKSPFKMLTLAVAGSCLLAISAPLALAQTADPYTVNASTAAAAPTASTAQSQHITVTAKLVEEKSDTLTVKLSIPVIAGMLDTNYQAALNGNIERRAMADIDKLKKQAAEDQKFAQESGYEFRPYDLEFSYEVKSDGSAAAGSVLSLVTYTYQYTGGAHGGTLATSYNVKATPQATRITLEQALGKGGLAKANNAVRQQIQANPDMFFYNEIVDFQGVSADQAFFIEKGIVHVVFQQYEIAPYAAGILKIAVTDKAAAGPSVSITSKQFVPGNGGAVLVPLRQTAASLGYKVAWNSKTRSAEVSRDAQWTSVTLNKNSYSLNKMAPIKLSAAPNQFKGTIYVPVDFFSTILKLNVTKDSKTGTITIKG